jgi:hypothetical protein
LGGLAGGGVPAGFSCCFIRSSVNVRISKELACPISAYAGRRLKVPTQPVAPGLDPRQVLTIASAAAGSSLGMSHLLKASRDGYRIKLDGVERPAAPVVDSDSARGARSAYPTYVAIRPRCGARAGACGHFVQTLLLCAERFLLIYQVSLIVSPPRGFRVGLASARLRCSDQAADTVRCVRTFPLRTKSRQGSGESDDRYDVAH